jgi:hypothetical protein
MPAILYDEILYRFNAKAVIDLCPASDALPALCIEQGLMYLGLCFTDTHVELLKRRLAAAVFGKFTTEGSPLYQASLAQVIHGLHGGQTTATDPQVIRSSAGGSGRGGRGGGRGRRRHSGHRGNDESKAGEKDQLDGNDEDDGLCLGGIGGADPALSGGEVGI